MAMMFQTLVRTLGQDQSLKIECGHCCHRNEWPRADAIRILGPDATPADIRRRLACGHCGDAKNVKVWI